MKTENILMEKSSITSLKILVLILSLFNIALIGFFFIDWQSNEEGIEDIFSAQRINIQDHSGINRVVLSNQDLIPPPIIAGKKYERKMTPAGIIFYDEHGNERGGIAISQLEKKNINALAFDYANADAVGLIAVDEDDSPYFMAGLKINDKDISGKPGAATNRINLMTVNGNAALVIKDKNEVVRLAIGVDSLGNPSFKMFDEHGEIMQEIK